jgi:hypothetical protein
MITTGTFTAVRVWPQVVPVAPGAGSDEQPATAAMSAGTTSAGAPSTPAAASTARLASLIVTVVPRRDHRAPSRLRHSS